MKLSLAKFLKDKSGVAATEFALIVPFLLFLLVAMVDYGFYINTAMKLENTARAAAEYILNGGDEDDIEDDIIMPSNLQLTEESRETLNVTTEFVCECIGGEAVDCDTGSCDAEGDYMRRYAIVTLDMEYQTLFPYPGVRDSITLRGHARIQDQD